jgi:UDP-N-acetylglucosamine--dolichyl-phosphate N-acetylglucosaminephosphotransferase
MIKTAAFLLSFFLALAAFPFFIKILRKKKITGTDVYKTDKRKVAERGGLLVLIISAIVVAAFSCFVEFSFANWIMILTIFLFGIYGLIDDICKFNRLTNFLIPFLIPLTLIFTKGFNFISTPILDDLGPSINGFILIIIFIAMCANLINLHSGFNGLSIGTGFIVLATLFLKYFIDAKSGNLTFFFILAGSFLGFLWYNRYPAKIFEGNVGTFTLGAAIGILIAWQNYFISGLIMLFPHIACFLMDICGYFRIKHAKFGTVRKDGTIEVPNPYELSWIFPYYFRMKEQQITYLMLFFTLVFCSISLFVPF